MPGFLTSQPAPRAAHHHLCDDHGVHGAWLCHPGSVGKGWWNSAEMLAWEWQYCSCSSLDEMSAPQDWTECSLRLKIEFYLSFIWARLFPFTCIMNWQRWCHKEISFRVFPHHIYYTSYILCLLYFYIHIISYFGKMSYYVTVSSYFEEN